MAILLNRGLFRLAATSRKCEWEIPTTHARNAIALRERGRARIFVFEEVKLVRIGG